MGYESKIFVVNKYDTYWNGKRDCEIIAMFNLRCAGCFTNVFQKESDCALYDFYDGEKQIIKDRYDDTLRECTLEEAVNLMETMNRQEPYRRFRFTLAALKAILHDDQWANLIKENRIAVLHYGY